VTGFGRGEAHIFGGVSVCAPPQRKQARAARSFLERARTCARSLATDRPSDRPIGSLGLRPGPPPPGGRYRNVHGALYSFVNVLTPAGVGRPAGGAEEKSAVVSLSLTGGHFERSFS
jgi:hypothetical protein